MGRPARGRAAITHVFFVAVLLAACGGEPPADTANDRTTEATDASPNGTDDGTTNGTNGGGDVEVEALPPPGPVDPVFPPDTPAYELLATGDCDELKAEVATWDAEVVEVEGADTIELYRSAAHACLGEWDEAIEAFDRIGAAPDATVDCPRAEVFAWLQRLVEARRADPTFEPELVPSTGASACPAEPTVGATGDAS